MATFSLNDRHRKEAERSARIQTEIITTQPITTSNNAAGDHTYRIPTIGLNPGHMPGTRPDIVTLGWYNQPSTS